MSRIIKAAELKVLIPNESQTVIPALDEGKKRPLNSQGGTVLESKNLLQDAREKAAEIVAKAEKEAALLLTEAKREEDAIRLRAKEVGFEEGYQEGLVEGKEIGLQKMGELIGVVEATVEEAAKLRASSLAAAEEDFLKFSLLLADKIIRKHVENDVSWLAPIITDSLAALGHVGEIIVRLNPKDLALLEENSEELALDQRGKLRFEADSSLQQGGCLIESESGMIDARLEQRLGKLAKHLLDVLYND